MWSKVGVEVTEKRGAFDEWLQRGDEDSYDKYRAQKAVVKLAVKVAKQI